ncbi:FAR-17a/AIG1-like protein [Scheffersomyces xylosifermentans]|uniref:FAR-17a/AIG1-like protein n=1 Tax=Scheffersomyces xylosifermentans TaxID=1304137 RepID=UPI00315C77E6
MSRRVVGNPTILAIDAVSLAIGFYGIHSNILTIELPDHLAKAGHWQFLTNLSLVYSLFVFLIGFVAHLTRSQTLFDLKNNIHPIGLALETIVAMIYWPLRIFFLQFLTADPSKFNLPLSTDLSIHLMPVVSLLIDYLVFMPRWTIKTSTALALMVSLTSGYWFLLKYLIDVDNGAKYPYAFLDVDSDEKRVVVFGMVAITAFSQFLLMRKLYDLIVNYTEKIDDEIDKELDKKNL